MGALLAVPWGDVVSTTNEEIVKDIFADLEKKPTTPGPWRRIKGDYGVRWCSLSQGWHNEPWSLAAWRLKQIKKPARLKKQKAVEGQLQGCLRAGFAENVLPMNAMLAVGFGLVDVRVGKVSLWGGDQMGYRVSRVEKLAAKHPKLDWRIVFDGPLSGKAYQRVGPKRWVLVEQNGGFA